MGLLLWSCSFLPPHHFFTLRTTNTRPRLNRAPAHQHGFANLTPNGRGVSRRFGLANPSPAGSFFTPVPVCKSVARPPSKIRDLSPVASRRPRPCFDEPVQEPSVEHGGRIVERIMKTLLPTILLMRNIRIRPSIRAI
jgi:hypothetical protein